MLQYIVTLSHQFAKHLLHVIDGGNAVDPRRVPTLGLADPSSAFRTMVTKRGLHSSERGDSYTAVMKPTSNRSRLQAPQNVVGGDVIHAAGTYRRARNPAIKKFFVENLFSYEK